MSDASSMRRVVVRGVPWYALAPATLALLLGVVASRRNSMSRDEMASWGFSRLSLGSLHTATGHVDGAFLPYYALVHLTPFATDHPTVLRVWSVAAAAVTVGFTAWTASELWTRWAGLVAGTLLAVNGALVGFAHTARPAALAAMLAAIATYLLVRARVRGAGGARLWIGYSVTLALAAYFTLFGILVLGAHLLLALVWWARRDRALLWRFLPAAAAAVLLIVPLVLYTNGQRDQIGWIRARSLDDAVRLLGVLGGAGRDFSGFSPPRSTVLLLCLVWCVVAAGVAFVRSNSDVADRLLVGPLLMLLPVAQLWVASQVLQPLEIARYAMAVPAGAALTVAGATSSLARWIVARGAPAPARVVAAAVVATVTAAVQLPALPVQLSQPGGPGTPRDVTRVVRLLRPGMAVVFAQNYDSTGTVGRFALYSHDEALLRTSWQSLPRGVALVFPRRITSVHPLRSVAIAVPSGRVHVVGGVPVGLHGSPRRFWSARLVSEGCRLLTPDRTQLTVWDCRPGTPASE